MLLGKQVVYAPSGTQASGICVTYTSSFPSGMSLVGKGEPSFQ